MPKANNGDTVTVHYTGKLDSGEQFDTSQGKEPIKFIIGEKKLIPGFELGVIGMEPGEKKTVTIPSDQAYGPSRKELIIQIERDKIPANIKPEIGQVLRFQKNPEAGQNPNEIIAFTVIGITDKELTLDANHPLSGKDLIFEIELLEIL